MLGDLERTIPYREPAELAVNSLAAIEQNPDGRANPMVNAGAIATTSLVLDHTLI